MIGPLTYVDAALLALMAISGLLAMYRGLTREILSITSWILGALAGFFIWRTQKELAMNLAEAMNLKGLPPVLPPIVLGIVVGIVVLFIVHMITARISDSMLDSQVGMIDRILGLAFGLARGYVLVVIPYMFFLNFFPDPKLHPKWVRDSKSLPYLDATGKQIDGAIRGVLPRIRP